MSTKRGGFGGPLEIAYRPPLSVSALVFSLHAGALVCIAVAAIPAAAKAGLMLLAILNWVRGSNAADREGCRLRLEADGRWCRRSLAGPPVPLQILPGGVVLPSIQILRFREPGQGCRTIILTGENASPALQRRLCVRLRLGADLNRTGIQSL